MNKKIIIIIFIFLILIFLGSCYFNNASEIDNENLVVHIIDVGQAQAIYIEYEDVDIIIDGGNNNEEKLMVEYLTNLEVNDIEYLIATHSHEDHIGGLDAVLKSYFL